MLDFVHRSPCFGFPRFSFGACLWVTNVEAPCCPLSDGKRNHVKMKKKKNLIPRTRIPVFCTECTLPGTDNVVKPFFIFPRLFALRKLPSFNFPNSNSNHLEFFYFNSNYGPGVFFFCCCLYFQVAGSFLVYFQAVWLQNVVCTVRKGGATSHPSKPTEKKNRYAAAVLKSACRAKTFRNVSCVGRQINRSRPQYVHRAYHIFE